jgi:predicted RNA-binding Zn-ribbon protein involved in translation (DUF1610 family)
MNEKRDPWIEAALFCHRVYGAEWNDEDNFFICPECGEPIYHEDYNLELEGIMMCCPICGFDWYGEAEG